MIVKICMNYFISIIHYFVDNTYYRLTLNIINELNLSKKDSKNLLNRLKDYQYVDEVPELIEGRYIRWINITNPNNIKLTNGGILCEIKIQDYVTLVLKNNMNRLFQINLDENLVFQKLTDQEKIILYAIDIIDN